MVLIVGLRNIEGCVLLGNTAAIYDVAMYVVLEV